MEDFGSNLYAIALSSLNPELRNVLSCLLNSKKVLPSDGSEKLPRDWRGLASLVNIPTEIVGNINEYPDKTSQVLDHWIKKNDGTATLGVLLDSLQKLDRFDVYDDLLDLIKINKFSVPNKQVALPNNHQHANHLAPHHEVMPGTDVITFDDRRAGFPQYYHAYVLYAAEDWEFVKELTTRMRAQGFKLCTLHDLEPGHQTQYAPVAQLISQRCHKIILVYSPAFLNSPDNNFYTNYAQAVGIESKERNIIPIIYKQCKLPLNLTYYHRLVYRPRDEWAPYNFWDKLSESLQQVKLPISGTNGVKSSHSAMNIMELTSNYSNGYIPETSRTNITAKTGSINDLLAKTDISFDDTKSLGNISQTSHTSTEKKKSGMLGKIKAFKFGKQKKLHG